MKQRRSIRLQGFDYGSEGWYFVTLCTHNRQCIFGDIHCDTVRHSLLGQIAQEHWLRIPEFFPWVTLDEFVIMPNHMHGIICIDEHEHSEPIPLTATTKPTGTRGTLGSVIRGFKSAVTKNARIESGAKEVWQRNYWEHIVRGHESLVAIREYVVNNPLRWDCDSLNPQNQATRRM